ncbi:MAG TPA: hypothetical protein VM118_06455 [Acidobacteriota bacterium]|nr:hypothetical protein [Acidobacteriota bacterium]
MTNRTGISPLTVVFVLAWAAIAGPPEPRADTEHLDPPADPPIATQVNLTSLRFLKDVDDGTNGLAELRVAFEINWGAGHAITPAFFNRDHDFDVSAPPFEAIANPLTLCSHTECSPAAVPILTVWAYESDKDSDPLLKALIAAGGGLIGGVGGFYTGPVGTAALSGAGAALGASLAGLIADFLNYDDPLFYGADYDLKWTYDQIPLPNGPCGGDKSTDFRTTEGWAYCLAASQLASSDTTVANLYVEYATYGVDSRFPFSRNAEYASGRFDLLREMLYAASLYDFEADDDGDPSKSASPMATRFKTASAEIAGIIADSTIWEANLMGVVPPELMAEAERFAHLAGDALAKGQYNAAINLYEDATVLLLPVMFPGFVYPYDYCNCSCSCHTDPQCDGVTNVLDVVQTVNVAFRGALPKFDDNCPYERTDADCTGYTNVIDVVKMVNVAFRGGLPSVNFCDGCTH